MEVMYESHFRAMHKQAQRCLQELERLPQRLQELEGELRYEWNRYRPQQKTMFSAQYMLDGLARRVETARRQMMDARQQIEENLRVMSTVPVYRPQVGQEQFMDFWQFWMLRLQLRTGDDEVVAGALREVRESGAVTDPVDAQVIYALVNQRLRPDMVQTREELTQWEPLLPQEWHAVKQMSAKAKELVSQHSLLFRRLLRVVDSGFTLRFETLATAEKG